MLESSQFFQAEAQFVSAVIAGAPSEGQMLRVVLARYKEHNEERRLALAMALAGALATRIATQRDEQVAGK